MKAFFLFGCLALLGNGFHPLYISVSTLHYNSSKEQLEITIKVFIDDMEEGLNQHFSQSFNLGLENELALADSLIGVYMGKKLSIAINETPMGIKFLGKELDGQVVWLYLEGALKNPIDKIQVSNQLLMETFKEQTNLVNIRVEQEKRSLILTQKKKVDVATF